jgi:membrane associated rhomboid family serine protease
MRRPPALSSVPRYPITVGIGLLATGVTLAWAYGIDISAAFMDFRACQGQSWRFITSILPHSGYLHLAFNLYWLWVFGTLVEDLFGHLKMAALVVLFAAGSSAAEYAFLDGGVGLSGVGYGLFGLLWVLSSRDERFHGAVDGQTVALFVSWFFVCIVLTYTKIMPVANIAHGVGAVLGILTGFVIVSRGLRRIAWISLEGVTVILAFLGASVARPYINFSPNAGEDIAYVAYLQLDSDQNERALDLYQQALRFNDHRADWWYNTGIVYQRLNRSDEAADAYRHAAALDPKDVRYQKALQQLRDLDEKP